MNDKRPKDPRPRPDFSEQAIMAIVRRAGCDRDEAIRILQATADRSAPVAHNHPGKAFS